MILVRLFIEFLKIGAFAVGGGMATLPFLYDLADETGWFTHQQLADMLAVSESTPGPIGINMATFVGFQVAGIGGSIAATLGVITPGVILVIIITSLLHRTRQSQYTDGLFYGIRPASLGLITSAGILVSRMTFLSSASEYTSINLKAIILAIILFFFMKIFKYTNKLHPVVFIAISACVGIVFSFAAES